MTTLDLGIDLDEVCYPFVTAVRDWLLRAGHDPGALSAAPETWGVPVSAWGLTEEAFIEHFCTAVRAGYLFRDGDPYPGAVAGVRELREDGHRIHLVTARRWAAVDAEIVAATEAWLADHDLPYDTLTFSEDKASVPTDVFLDDAVHNYDALERAGRHPVLYDQPYNRDHPGRRVRSWEEFVRYVRRVADGVARGHPVGAGSRT